MKKTKLLTSIFLIIFASSILGGLMPANATISITSQYGFTNQSSYYASPDYNSLTALDPSSTTAQSAQAQTFNVAIAGYISSISVNMWKVGSPNFIVKCRIEGTGNSYTGNPNGTIYASSTNTYSASALSTDTGSQYTFYFNGSYNMIQNQKYALIIYVSAFTSGSGGNDVRIGFDYTSPAGEGQYNYYQQSHWVGASATSDMLYYVYVDSTAPTSSTISYSYTITPDVTYNFYSWGTGAVLTQGTVYSYVGSVLNNTVPYVSGNYSIYKTALFNSNLGATITNASDALASGTVTLNQTGTYAGGIFLIDIFQDFVLNSSATYQGIRVNGTVSGSSETFTSDLVLMALEPSYQFIGQITGDIFDHAVIAYFPTEITLRQDTPYRFDGFILLGGIYLNATGNFTLYSTGLSSLYNVATIGTYSLVNTGTIGNGTFSFTFGPRSSANTLFEGYKVQITTDSGIDANFTYNLGWYRLGGTSHTNPSPPYPSASFAPFPSSPTDTTGISGTMTTIVSFIILFLIIGLPAVILGAVAGLPGLIMGGIFGLGIGVIAGLLPFWFIFLIGTGTVMTLLMWRRNKAEGQ